MSPQHVPQDSCAGSSMNERKEKPTEAGTPDTIPLVPYFWALWLNITLNIIPAKVSNCPGTEPASQRGPRKKLSSLESGVCVVFCVPSPSARQEKVNPKKKLGGHRWAVLPAATLFSPLPAQCVSVVASCPILRVQPYLTPSAGLILAQPPCPYPQRSLSPVVGVASQLSGPPTPVSTGVGCLVSTVWSLILDFAVLFVPVTRCFQTGHLS